MVSCQKAKGSYLPYLRTADRALLAGYHRYAYRHLEEGVCKDHNTACDRESWRLQKIWKTITGPYITNKD